MNSESIDFNAKYGKNESAKTTIIQLRYFDISIFRQFVSRIIYS